MVKFRRVYGLIIIMAVLLSAVLFVPQLAIADHGGREPGGYALHQAWGTEATDEPFQQIEPEEDTGSLVPVGPLQTGWQTIMADGFEGAWPGVWTITRSLAVDAYWNDTDAISHSGSWSAFCAGGGSEGVAPGENYPNYMSTFMIYGPFSLADAVGAKVDHYLWLDSESGWDKFLCQASLDGEHFYGGGEWGNTGGWVARSFDLADVCGEPNVWIAFVFKSDESNPSGDYYGAFIDDVVLQKDVGTDLKAVEVYFSTEPGDMTEEHVVTEPTVGQDVYFHFRFSCIAPGTTPTFHNEFKLDGSVFDSAEGTAEGGHTYVWWSDIPWAATAGAHTVTGVLDVYDDVSEADETNNEAEKSWTAAQFDLEAVEVYLSTQVGDMAKEHVVSEPAVGQEIYFHLKWNCYGSGLTPSFRVELELDGIVFDYGEITVEDGMDYTLWTDIPWTATAGAHTLTGVLDVNDDIAESNEANNEASKSWGGAAVDISVVLQGGSRPPEAWEVPITIKFFSPGADVMTDTPIYEFDLTTAKSDGTAICQCVGVTPGTYEITAQASNCPECTEGNCTLTNVKRSVVISAPSTAVDMGTLLAGDANCDGIINISDFGILAVAYMCTEGEPCYECRADFDCNGIINISDFGLLAVNYMQISPIAISG
jgi:hypothetical protein